MNANFLKLDHSTQTILIRASAIKKTETYGTYEYRMLQEVRRDFPNYKIDIVKNRKPKTDDKYKGLTYKYMKKYLEDKGNEELINDFKNLTNDEEDIVASYIKVREWFLKNCPEIEEYRQNRRDEIKSILNKEVKNNPSPTLVETSA